MFRGGTTLTYQGDIFHAGERFLPYEHKTMIKKEIAAVIFYKEGQHLLSLKKKKQTQKTTTTRKQANKTPHGCTIFLRFLVSHVLLYGLHQPAIGFDRKLEIGGTLGWLGSFRKNTRHLFCFVP